MSANTVDQKVVEMRFDNKDFEKNTHQTMSTLDKLKQSLKFTGATKGLEEIETKQRGMKFEGLAAGIETVQMKFSAMEAIAFSALNNITNRAINAGISITKALTIDPISTGFQEYEEKMGSVRTMLMSSGYGLDTIKEQLEELNKYADQTIYSFQDMTSNIGKFTNAGVDLKVAVQAMKGISNEAAVSGASSMEASRAMYNIAQSLSMGYMQFIDWKSIENANMATVEFKTNLMKTGVAMGKIKDLGNGMYSTGKETYNLQQLFKDGLKDQWLTSDVLLTTLQEYSNEETEIGKKAYDAATKVRTFSQLMATLKEAAQSGWGMTWELLVGDFNEATDFLTEISDKIGGILDASSKARNEMLKAWKEGGGRAAAIDSLRNIYNAIGALIKPIRDAFREVFPPMTAKRLIEMTEAVKNFTSKLILTSKASKQVHDIFKAFFSVIKVGVNIFKTGLTIIFKAISAILGFKGSALDAVHAVSQWVQGLADAINKSKVFTKTAEFVSGAVDKIRDAVAKAIDKIKQLFTASGISSFVDVLKKLWEFISFIGGKVVNIAAIMVNGIIKAFSSGSNTMLSLVNGTLLGTILLKIKQFVDNFHNTSKEILSIGKTFKEVLLGVKGALKAYQEDLEAKKLLKIAIAVGILAVSLKLLSTIPMEDLIKGLGGIGVLFGGLMGALKILSKYMGDLKKVGRTSVLMISMAIAIGILAGALKKIASIETEKLLPAIIALGAIMAYMIGTAKLLGKGGKNLTKGAGQLILMAVAVRILASAIKALGKLEPEQMLQGIAGFGAIMLILVGLSSYMSRQKADMIKGSAGIIAMAIGIRIIASAIKSMGSMENDQFLQGLAGFGAIMLILVGLSSYLSRHGGTFAKGGASMLILSVSLLIMAKVAKQFGEMEWESLGKAGAAIGGILVFATILALLGKMGPSILLGATSLLIAGVALSIMVPVLKKLGEIKWETMAKAGGYLLGIMVALVLLGAVASALMDTGAILALAALAGTLLLFGAGIALIGAGLMMIGAGIAALAASLTVSAAAIVAQLTIILTGIIMLIPNTIKALAEGLVLFIVTIANSFDQIADALVTIIVKICDVLITCVPKIVETILVIFTSLLESLAEHYPDMLDAGMRIIIAFLEGLALKLPDLIQAGFDLIISFINGVADAIRNNAQAIKDAMQNLGQAMLDGLCTFLGINSPSKKFMEIGLNIIQGLINGLVDGIVKVVTKVKEIANKMAEAVHEKIAKFKEIGGKLINALKDGVADFKDKVVNKVKSVAKGAVSTLKDFINNFKEAGKNLMNGLKDGITAAKDKVVNKVKSIANGAIDTIKKALGIHSPSTVFRKIGEYTIQGMINGISMMGKAVSKVSEKVGNLAINGMNKSIDKVADLLSTDIDSEPTIKPVLDLSEIQNGVGKMNGMFNNQTVGVNANLNAISNMSRNRMNTNNEMLSAIKDLGKSLDNAGTTNNYNVNGVNYSGDSDVQSAIETLVRAVTVEGRV